MLSSAGSSSSAPAPAPSHGLGLHGRQGKPQLSRPCAHPTPPGCASPPAAAPMLSLPSSPVLPWLSSGVGSCFGGHSFPQGIEKECWGLKAAPTPPIPHARCQVESLPVARRKGSSTKECHAILPGCLWAHPREQALERLRPAPQIPPGEQPPEQERCWWGQSPLLSWAGEQTWAWAP